MSHLVDTMLTIINLLIPPLVVDSNFLFKPTKTKFVVNNNDKQQSNGPSNNNQPILNLVTYMYKKSTIINKDKGRRTNILIFLT